MKKRKNFTISEIYRDCERIVVPDGTTDIFTDVSFQKPLRGIMEVVISDDVKNIGGCSFMNTSIKTLFIPYSVETIESLAFYGCKYLSEVIIENGSLLKEIEMGAFKNCPSLKEIVIPRKTKVSLNAYDDTINVKRK